MSSIRPQPPRPGDPLRIDFAEQVVGDLNRQDRDGRHGGYGLIHAALIAGGYDWFIQAYITRVYPDDAATVPYPASQVFYDVVGVGRPDARIVHGQPFYGRPVRDPTHRILAAMPDWDAVIVQTRDLNGQPRGPRLLLFDGAEVRATRVCGGG